MLLCVPQDLLFHTATVTVQISQAILLNIGLTNLWLYIMQYFKFCYLHESFLSVLFLLPEKQSEKSSCS